MDKAGTDSHGFTIIEIAIFLFIVGAILSVAAMAWSVLAQGRQVAAAKNILAEVDSCLLDYAIMARKIPDSNYFSSYCSKIDPWGKNLRLVTNAGNNPINCGASTPGTLTVKIDPWTTVSEVAWIVISSGPNRSFDYTLTATTLDISTGDDIYVFESDTGIHEEICE